MSEEVLTTPQEPPATEDEARQAVMTKAELVDEVARVVQLTKKQAEAIVNIVFDSIVESLRAGEKIELRGFGSFRLRSRKSRTGRNPKTGERVEVPSKRIPYFKPGKELKELINQKLAESDSPAPSTSGDE
ncbi:MAG TPA: integration host factor subunit beta [Thermoanaerobaculia bacterium]|nr:integration host factor subunit beta [Thermoanaerobaculia bacterium]